MAIGGQKSGVVAFLIILVYAPLCCGIVKGPEQTIIANSVIQIAT